MGQIDRLKIVSLIILFLLAALGISRFHLSMAAPKLCPLSTALDGAGPWHRAGDQYLRSDITSFLNLDDYLFRTFRRGNNTITLYVGYYKTAGKVGAAHDPMVCFPGQGWKLTGKRQGQSPLLPLGKVINYSSMIAEREGERELVVYWFQAFDHTTTNTFAQKVSLLARRLSGGSEDNAFVRITTPLGERSTEEAMKTIQDFIASFYPMFYRYVTGS
jgi:EpsI family protein